jgi:pimeloyl-ACP methyl ester carboxylesterase
MNENISPAETEVSPKVIINKREIPAYGVNIPVVEASPREPLSDGKTRNKVLIMQGWGTNVDTYSQLQRLLARDRTVITMGHPRRGGEYPSGRSEIARDVANVEWYKAQHLLAYINGQEQQIDGDPERYDVFAHSEGAIGALVAACEAPEKFANIVLFGPGGLQGKDSLLRLIGRFGLKIVAEQRTAGTPRKELLQERYTHLPHELSIHSGARTTAGGTDAAWSNPQDVKKAINETTRGSISYILANIKRAIEEGKAISEADITEMLEYARSKGIKVVVMQGVDDKAIPMNMVQGTLVKGMKETKDPEEAGLNAYVDGVVSVPMLHDDPIQNAGALAPALAGVLDTLSNPPTKRTKSVTAVRPRDVGPFTKLKMKLGLQ